MKDLTIKVESKFRAPQPNFPQGVWEAAAHDDGEHIYVVTTGDTCREAVASALRLVAAAIENGSGPFGGGGGKSLKREPLEKPNPTLQVRP